MGLPSRKALRRPLLSIYQRGSSSSLTGARPSCLAGTDKRRRGTAAAKGRVPLPEKSASPALSLVQNRSRQKRRGSSSPPGATWRRLALCPAPTSRMVRRRSRQPNRVTWRLQPRESLSFPGAERPRETQLRAREREAKERGGDRRAQQRGAEPSPSFHALSPKRKSQADAARRALGKSEGRGAGSLRVGGGQRGSQETLPKAGRTAAGA